MGTATGLESDWKRAALVSTAEQCIDEPRHLIPLRHISGYSLVPDENEPTQGAKVSEGGYYANECSGRLGKGFTDNLGFGHQPIVKVVTVFTTTLFIYFVSA